MPGLNRTVIDNVLAAKAFPGEQAVGKRIYARTGGPEPEPFEVIGVVRHQRSASLAVDGRETMYVTDGQFGFGNVFNWIVRTNGDPSSLTPAVRAAIKEINPRFVINNLRSVRRAGGPGAGADAVRAGVHRRVRGGGGGAGGDRVVRRAVDPRQAADGGDWGADGVRREQWISILQLVAGQGLKLSVLGIGIGLLAAFAVTRVMSTMLVGVSPTDPLTFATIAAFFLAVTALACWIPARRASRWIPSRHCVRSSALRPGSSHGTVPKRL